MDTGAIGASYINKTIFALVRDHFDVITHNPPRSVPLANGSATMEYEHEITLVGFVSHNGEKTHFQFPARVANIHCDLIIGLPVLEGALFPFCFVKMAENRTNFGAPESLAAIDLLPPFASPAEHAPEEDLIPDPISFNFGDGLAFIASEIPENVQVYKDNFRDQISQDMIEATDIVDFMLTQEAIETFVPHNWDGLHDHTVHLNWKADPPNRKPRPYHVNPVVWAKAEPELRRLMEHFYVPSQSEVTSNLVVAPKATDPFVRICGDYPWLKPYIETGHYPIPNPKLTLERTAKYPYYIDADMANAFHQLRLSDLDSERLSLVTPLGQLKPKFLPEGIPPASALLQEAVNAIFGDLDFAITIFDNFLIMGETLQQLMENWKIFVRRCHKHNLKLKLKKTWIGVREVKFFGYRVSNQRYWLEEERAAAVRAIPFPGELPGSRDQKVKRMQRYLGSALFFSNFVPHYSDITADLNDMVRLTFNWDPKSWSKDYPAIFQKHKESLAESFALFHPDYEAEWILRTDASLAGIGGVLIQIVNGEHQPIMFISCRISDAAAKWSVIEQEAFGIFYCVKKLAYYLRAKAFVVECDHRNLVWMEQSIIPKIIRMRLYLSSYDFLVRHIPGKKNLTADLLSRDFPPESISSILATLDSVIQLVHGGRAGHHGVKRTWQALNRAAPGHGLSLTNVRDYISECLICQKDRLRQAASLPAITKTLNVDHARHISAMDTVEMLEDKSGNRYLLVIINLFTKFVALYAVKDKSARTTAAKLFLHCCTYGLTDLLHSDPGSDFCSELLKHMTDWLGTTRSFSIVNRPQADGVEPVNREIIRHLRALTMETSIQREWSSDEVLPIVQLIINESVHSETGVSPLEATFGSHDTPYFTFGKGKSPTELQEYVQVLDHNLKHLRSLSANFQAKVKAERTKDQPKDSANNYQHGDFVLKLAGKLDRKTKLHGRNLGPYRVICHKPGNNLVQVQDLIKNTYRDFHVSDLQVFVGSEEQAFSAACIDDNQHTIEGIIAFRGNPLKRTTCSFLVQYTDGDKVWREFSPDVSSTAPYEAFCNRWPMLRVLLLDTKQVNTQKRLTLMENFPEFSGAKLFAPLQCFGWEWYYDQSQLPMYEHTLFVTEVTLTPPAKPSRTRAKTLDAHFPQFNDFVIPNVTPWWFLQFIVKEPFPHNTVQLSPEDIQKYGLNQA